MLPRAQITSLLRPFVKEAALDIGAGVRVSFGSISDFILPTVTLSFTFIRISLKFGSGQPRGS
jgi:hypothetical protein